ncbi:MAG: hypothetical protein O3A93_07190 [Chloroflexi bacterium]|nr:hypothetical protein [Chloroflexota bacterium]MDA1271028.1 hypothetical protein [Chloroflexota bacterium]
MTADELANVLNFEGYGNKSARYWFIGMEEGGGSMDQLTTRVHTFDPHVEELESAIMKLGFDINLYVPTWRVMSKLILAMDGADEWWETASAKRYQAEKLGRFKGDTFLADLMPLPCPRLNEWPYEAIYPTKAEYIKAVRPMRIAMLRSELLEIQPPYVFCYGKGNWRFYKEIFEGVEFKSTFDGKILVGRQGTSTIILLYFLSPYLVKTELIGEIAKKFGMEKGRR